MVTPEESTEGQCLPIKGNQLITEMQVPVLSVMPWQEDASQKVVGSNPSAGKGIFAQEISVKV